MVENDLNENEIKEWATGCNEREIFLKEDVGIGNERIFQTTKALW